MTVEGDGTILVSLKYTRLLNWLGQLVYLGLTCVDNTRMIVNNFCYSIVFYAASKMLSAMAIIK